MAKGKSVTTNEKKVPVKIADWMKEYEGAGQEDISRDDITMPRLKLGQALSPEVQSKNAQEGDLIHNITREVLCEAGDSIRIIPIAYSKEYIIWYDRKGPHGSGIAARAKKVNYKGQIRFMWDKPNTTFEDKVAGKVPVKYTTKRFIDEDGLGDWGSQIPGDENSPPAAIEHHNYVVMLPDHDNQLVALSLARTAAKKAKEFNTLLKMGKAPTFGRIYKLGTFMDRKDDNNFANYQFSGYEIVEDPELGQELADLHFSLKDKGVNVDFSDDDDGSHPEAKDNKKF